MDVDLQDPPDILVDMYDMIKDGSCDRVATRRSNRKGEAVVKSFLSKSFYKTMNVFSDVKLVDGARDYCMMSRRFVNAVLSLSEKSRFSKGLFSWVGYNTKWLSFDNSERSSGKSKWSLGQLFSYSVDGIVSFSGKPLRIVSGLGVVSCLLALILIIIIIIRTVCFGDPVAGWPSLVCIILFLFGLQQLSLGIIGSYILRIFTEVRNRPDYFVSESNVIDDKGIYVDGSYRSK